MTLYSSARRAAGSAPPWLRERLRGETRRLAVTDAAAEARRGEDDWLQHPHTPWFAALAALMLIGALIVHDRMKRYQSPLQDAVIEAAVTRALFKVPLPSPAAKTYEKVARSVVRVRGFGHVMEDGAEAETGVGTGVVILETGKILTNLHVVHGAEHVTVVFSDGSETKADVVGMRAEHDLAVLQAAVVPDDLPAATLTTTGGLEPGDTVVAVGFPFGVGPSVSAGVVSGLRREWRSMRGERVLTNLIQFDAAVNPGNSGGPLLNAKGEVVGVVTGLLNPTEGRFFIGIGFAVPIENAAAAVGMPPF